MKAFVALLILLNIALLAVGQLAAVNQELIDTVNSSPRVTWTAAHNQFSKWSVADVKKILGTRLELKAPLRELEQPVQVMSSQPDSFDSRVAFAGCVHPIRNQAQCGSCWAFGATEALSDRFCIASNKTINVVLSPQDLVSCDHLNFGCSGGQLFVAWHYMEHTGVVSEACFPYASQQGKAPSCPSKCVDGSSYSANKYHASSYYKVSPTFSHSQRVADIQAEIAKNGPVEAAFSVYQDFMSYKTGVYQHVTGSFLGGHAIKIVGWGVENTAAGANTPYWIVANSWSDTWGEEGFFKILRGVDECGIEGEVYAGTPNVANAPTSA